MKFSPLTALAVFFAVALALVGAPAVAAVGPSTSTLVYPTKLPTYSGSILNMTPAPSATDVFVLSGSATKTITVLDIKCTGTSTASGVLPVEVIRRSTANTAGTSTSPTIAQHDSNDPAATAVAKAYTANPTVGTSAGVVDVGLMGTLVNTAPGTNGYDLQMAYMPFDFREPVVLRGAAQSVAINFGGASAPAGTLLSCTVVWTEN